MAPVDMANPLLPPTMPTTLNSFPKEYSLLSNNNATQDTTALVELVVSGILDIAKLENAHRELVRLWPALGGKLVTSKKPYAFTSGDIVNFKSRRLDKTLSDLSLVTTSSLSSTSKPSLHPLAGDIDNLFHFDAIEKVPPADTIFALRVTVLQDATLLGFRLAHHLFDGHACFETVQSYCDVVNGRPIPELVPPPDIDSLLSKQVAGEQFLPPSVKLDDTVWPERNITLSTWGTLCFTIIFLIRMLMVRVGLRLGDEERTLHLPGTFVAQLMDECRNDLNKTGLNLKDVELTKNNVITAWFLKSFYSKFSPSDKIGVDVMTSFNFRPHIPSPKPNTTYLHNSFYNLRTPFPSLAHIQSLSKSEIALAIRRTCLMHRQPSVVKANLQFCEKVDTAHAPHPPDRSLTLLVEHEMPFFSHWTSFEYHRLEFTGALVQNKAPNDSSITKEGNVLMTLPSVVFPFKFKIRPLTFVTKDGQGGYWIRARLPTTGWRGVEESMLQLSQ